MRRRVRGAYFSVTHQVKCAGQRRETCLALTRIEASFIALQLAIFPPASRPARSAVPSSDEHAMRRARERIVADQCDDQPRVSVHRRSGRVGARVVERAARARQAKGDGKREHQLGTLNCGPRRSNRSIVRSLYRGPGPLHEGASFLAFASERDVAVQFQPARVVVGQATADRENVAEARRDLTEARAQARFDDHLNAGQTGGIGVRVEFHRTDRVGRDPRIERDR